MADFRGGFLKKRHRIAVAWIAMAVVVVMAEMADLFCFLSAVEVGLTLPSNSFKSKPSPPMQL